LILLLCPYLYYYMVISITNSTFSGATTLRQMNHSRMQLTNITIVVFYLCLLMNILLFNHYIYLLYICKCEWVGGVGVCMCMYVCLYVCMYVCMYACFVYVCMLECVYECMYVRMYVCMNVYNIHRQARTHTHTHTQTHTHTHTHTYIYIYI
jgi:hypothetical protein